jgi:hypothetical protein
MQLVFDFKICVMEIMSKFRNRRPVLLQGELKLTETEKKISTYSSVVIIVAMLHCTRHQPVSLAELG